MNLKIINIINTFAYFVIKVGKIYNFIERLAAKVLLTFFLNFFTR